MARLIKIIQQPPGIPSATRPSGHIRTKCAHAGNGDAQRLGKDLMLVVRSDHSPKCFIRMAVSHEIERARKEDGKTIKNTQPKQQQRAAMVCSGNDSAKHCCMLITCFLVCLGVEYSGYARRYVYLGGSGASRKSFIMVRVHGLSTVALAHQCVNCSHLE